MPPTPGRLLRWLTPERYETLPSFLFRLGRFNFYDPPSLIHGLWRERLAATPHPYDSWSYPAQPASYAFLEALTGIPSETLYTLSGHPLAAILTPPYLPVAQRPLFGLHPVDYLSPSVYNHTLRPNLHAPYCPHCLAERRSYPITGLIQLVAVCLRHQCLLQEACPHCQAALSVRAITSGVCAHCAWDLTLAQPRSVAADPLGLLAQQQQLAWLGLADPPAAADLGLPPASPRVLVALLFGFHRSLRRHPPPLYPLHQPPDWPHLPQPVLPLGQVGSLHLQYRLTASAFQALTHWPDEFFALLDAYRLPAVSSQSPNLRRMLGALYTLYLQHLWQHEAFAFVQATFDTYFLRYFADQIRLQRHRRFHQSAYLQSESERIDTQTAAHLLQVSKPTLETLIRSGTLPPVQVRPVIKLDRAQVLAFQHFRAQHIDLIQAARLLGLSRYLTGHLLQDGWLTRQTFPNYDPRKIWVNRDDVEQLRQRLQAALTPGPVPLFYASSHLPTWSGRALLRALLEGQLRAYVVIGSSSFFHALRFDPADLEVFLASHP